MTDDVKFTEEEIEVVSDYLLRKIMRLEENHLEDSKCYPLLCSFRTKLQRLQNENKEITGK